jgi:4-hydroxyproline epimerase
MPARTIKVIDSHTGGEPTRTVIAGGPDLGRGSLAERRLRFRDEFDQFRNAIIGEPRGSDVLVGAMLTEPTDPTCAAGVVFFNNVGVLNMCGHGSIGVAVTLAHLGRIAPGLHRLETPVGIVGFEYHGDHRVTIENVPSYRFRKSVPIEVPGHGTISGDIAWGGNWFYLVNEAAHRQRIALDNIAVLTELACGIRDTLDANHIMGEDGGVIDHIELFGPPSSSECDSRSFVLCPGMSYDRSPCGTGTSAKLACLAADGKLAEGDVWRQESIVGSVFEGRFRRAGERIIPSITGTAYVTAETALILDPEDPFEFGIRSM